MSSVRGWFRLFVCLHCLDWGVCFFFQQILEILLRLLSRTGFDLLNFYTGKHSDVRSVGGKAVICVLFGQGNIAGLVGLKCQMFFFQALDTFTPKGMGISRSHILHCLLAEII